MKRWKITFSFIALTLCLLLVASDIFAGTGRRRGTAGAQELLIPVGSIGTALGGANLATTEGTEAMYWNPAGLAASQYSTELMISHLTYIADMNVNYVAGYFQNETFGALGFSIKTLGFGDIPVTTNESPDGTGEMFSPTFLTLGATYSRAMTNKIFFGASVKLVSEKIMRESATGVAFDFGLRYDTGMGIKGAVCLKNIGTNMAFDGSDLEVFTSDISDRPDAEGENTRIPLAAFDMPTLFEIGLSYDYKVNDQNGITVMGSFMNDNYALDEYRVGLEYNFNNLVFLRGSYQTAYDADNEKFVAADQDNFLWGPSFGAGLNLKLGSEMGLRLDYAYRVTEIFDDNQWFTLRFNF
ncbi:PorV/PorQ family protein [candidate division KSB1 bacterium]|nr:PorV/PorQ family protein [candidate division KSB1 bacterium]